MGAFFRKLFHINIFQLSAKSRTAI